METPPKKLECTILHCPVWHHSETCRLEKRQTRCSRRATLPRLLIGRSRTWMLPSCTRSSCSLLPPCRHRVAWQCRSWCGRSLTSSRSRSRSVTNRCRRCRTQRLGTRARHRGTRAPGCRHCSISGGLSCCRRRKLSTGLASCFWHTDPQCGGLSSWR